MTRAHALYRLARYAPAAESYRQAIAIKPDFADAHLHRGDVLRELGQYAAAVASYDQAIALKDDYADAYFNRGNLRRGLGELDAALTDLDRAIALRPGHAAAHNNRGIVLDDLRQIDAAVASYDRAIELKPAYAQAYFNRSIALLVSGDYLRGFRDYEWRWQLEHGRASDERRNFSRPLWLGDASLAGKTILLHSEQGFGDTIQFCRYVGCVAALGATVILEVPQPLARLFASLQGVARLVVRGDALPDFDFHCPLMSLPHAFKTTLSSVPGDVPYLEAPGAQSQVWCARLGHKSRLRVGLTWSGGARPDQQERWSVDNGRRNIPLASLAPLRNDGIEFYSLQKGEPAESELALHKRQGWNGPELRDHTSLLEDFADTAALMEQLDLIISVDTATAHLAGALGKPVWILNRLDTCWRWLLERSDSPWYPSARLYRQRQTGDWSDVIERVRCDLERLAEEVPQSDESARASGATRSRGAIWSGPAGPAAMPPCVAPTLPEDPGTILERAVASHRRGSLEEAERGYAQVLSRAPGQFDALHMLGAIALQTGRYARAVELLTEALRRKPGAAAAENHLAQALAASGCWEPALASYERLIRARPDSADAHLGRADALNQLGRSNEAIASCDRAIALRPDAPLAYLARAFALKNLERAEDALESCEAAVAVAPDLAEAWDRRGCALLDLPRPQEALASFERAIELRPDFARARLNAGISCLQMGRFERGWELAEWRARPGGPVAAGQWAVPRFAGHETLAGRAILLHAEQGLGDTIQFARYAKLLAARGAHVILSVQPGLRALLDGLGSGIRVVAEIDLPPPYDCHCPLLSLPFALGTLLETIPAEVPYLAADPKRVTRWREVIGGNGFKIGICWQGSKLPIDIGRSFALEHFDGLSRIPGVRLISLQKGHGTEQLEALPEGMRVERLGGSFDAGPDAFLDAAAVMQIMDLIITSDTSIAHLAGALARPTWVALKHAPEWRWMLDRDDSPWYPTLRLFRQARRRDWRGVFDRMHAALAARIGGAV
jgi:tetratricopeptide (TPR) repeat protein